jgi:hypothetical protein
MNLLTGTGIAFALDFIYLLFFNYTVKRVHSLGKLDD